MPIHSITTAGSHLELQRAQGFAGPWTELIATLSELRGFDQAIFPESPEVVGSRCPGQFESPFYIGDFDGLQFIIHFGDESQDLSICNHFWQLLLLSPVEFRLTLGLSMLAG